MNTVWIVRLVNRLCGCIFHNQSSLKPVFVEKRAYSSFLLQEPLESSKPLTAFRSFDSPRREVVHAPTRSKSVLSAFFVKQKTPKRRAGPVS